MILDACIINILTCTVRAENLTVRTQHKQQSSCSWRYFRARNEAACFVSALSDLKHSKFKWDIVQIVKVFFNDGVLEENRVGRGSPIFYLNMTLSASLALLYFFPFPCSLRRVIWVHVHTHRCKRKCKKRSNYLSLVRSVSFKVGARAPRLKHAVMREIKSTPSISRGIVSW